MPASKDTPSGGFRTQLLEIRHLPAVHLPERSYSSLRNLTLPTPPCEHVLVIGRAGADEEQPPKAPSAVQYQRYKAHQKTFITYRNQAQLVALPVELPPGVEPGPRLEWGRQWCVAVEIFPFCF